MTNSKTSRNRRSDGTQPPAGASDEVAGSVQQIGRMLLVPLWNRAENRPRALWRILGAFTLVALGSQVLPLVVLGDSDLPVSILGLGQNIFAAGSALLVAVVWARYVDRRPVVDYGLDTGPRWAREAAVGVGIAMLAWGLALAVHLSAGWAHVSAVLSPGAAEASLPFSLALIVFCVQFVLVGLWEELLFRGLILKNAAEGLDTRWLSDQSAVLGGLVASSLLFGVVHASQASSILALGFWVLMGGVLGSAYILTDSLALPVGVHFATDLAFNNVYGLSNVRPETADVVPTILRPEFTGPERFTEVSGIVNIGAVIVIVVLVVGYVSVQYGRIDDRVSSKYADK